MEGDGNGEKEDTVGGEKVGGEIVSLSSEPLRVAGGLSFEIGVSVSEWE